MPEFISTKPVKDLDIFKLKGKYSIINPRLSGFLTEQSNLYNRQLTHEKGWILPTGD